MGCTGWLLKSTIGSVFLGYKWYKTRVMNLEVLT